MTRFKNDDKIKHYFDKNKKKILVIVSLTIIFGAFIPFQIKEDDYIHIFEFEKMEDFQFYGTEFTEDGDEYLQLRHRLFIYKDIDGYIPHRDGCKKLDCEAFIVDKNNNLYTSFDSTDDVTTKTRYGEKGLLEETRTKRCFIFGLYCPKEESLIKNEDRYDWTYHTILYLPETIKVKVYPYTCTDADKNGNGYVREDKKECAINEDNYVFKNAYEYYK